jgi:hypothetical protein
MRIWELGRFPAEYADKKGLICEICGPIFKLHNNICKKPLFLLPDSNMNQNGAVAQLVEQRTENPCVGGSIPPHTTKTLTIVLGFFVFRKLITIYSCLKTFPLHFTLLTRN